MPPDVAAARKVIDAANRAREVKGKDEVTVKVAPTRNEILRHRFKHVPMQAMHGGEHAARGPEQVPPPKSGEVGSKEIPI